MGFFANKIKKVPKCDPYLSLQSQLDVMSSMVISLNLLTCWANHSQTSRWKTWGLYAQWMTMKLNQMDVLDWHQERQPMTQQPMSCHIEVEVPGEGNIITKEAHSRLTITSSAP